MWHGIQSQAVDGDHGHLVSPDAKGSHGCRTRLSREATTTPILGAGLDTPTEIKNIIPWIAPQPFRWY